jgi:hypothetical protein
MLGGQSTLTWGVMLAIRQTTDEVTYVQADAAMNSGNSGGALLNLHGNGNGGYTAKVRPPASITDLIKRAQMAAYGLGGQPLAGYELDHLISLELGGAPADVADLWPQPWTGTANASQKDAVESYLRREACRALCRSRMRGGGSPQTGSPSTVSNTSHPGRRATPAFSCDARTGNRRALAVRIYLQEASWPPRGEA